MALDFAESNVVRFAVAYLCKRVITLRPDDPNATMKPTTTKRQGVVIELHSANEPVGLFREIIRSASGKAILGAVEILEGSFTDSPYAKVLELAAERRAAAQAKAAAKVKACQVSDSGCDQSHGHGQSQSSNERVEPLVASQVPVEPTRDVRVGEHGAGS